MISIDIETLCKIISGTPSFDVSNKSIKGVEIDSRRLKDNMLFVPIIGERADGHSFFTDELAEKGVVSLWNIEHDKPESDLPVIFVEDTLKAMQKLAKYYIESIDPIVIGITGSNGKTSVKDITQSLLEKKYKVHATDGNFNSDIGLPLTVLRMKENTEVCILEMGIDKFGDMALMSEIANPNIAIVTTIGEAHLDDLLTREGIAKAKLEFIPNLKYNSVIIYNGDEPLIENELKNHNVHSKLISFGLGANNTYIPELTEVSDELRFVMVKPPIHNLRLKTVGAHQMLNAAAAIACAVELDIPEDEIRDAVYETQFNHFRTEIQKAGNITFLNDAYKSNPQALRAALNTLYMQKGYSPKIVILGDMLGIGKDCVQYHIDIGTEIDPKEVSYVLTCGGEYAHNLSKSAEKNFRQNAKHFENTDTLIDFLKTIDLNGSIILLKASRSMEFEKIAERIAKELV